MHEYGGNYEAWLTVPTGRVRRLLAMIAPLRAERQIDATIAASAPYMKRPQEYISRLKAQARFSDKVPTKEAYITAAAVIGAEVEL